MWQSTAFLSNAPQRSMFDIPPTAAITVNIDPECNHNVPFFPMCKWSVKWLRMHGAYFRLASTVAPCHEILIWDEMPALPLLTQMNDGELHCSPMCHVEGNLRHERNGALMEAVVQAHSLLLKVQVLCMYFVAHTLLVKCLLNGSTTHSLASSDFHYEGVWSFTLLPPSLCLALVVIWAVIVCYSISVSCSRPLWCVCLSLYHTCGLCGFRPQFCMSNILYLSVVSDVCAV